MYYIFAFRSRNQSMRFFEALKREGIYSKIISTPRAVSVGCGLSVQMSGEHIDSAQRILGFNAYDSFLGLFSVDNYGYAKRITR